MVLAIIWQTAGPLLEGYGIANVARTSNYWAFFPLITLRPIALVPEYVSGLISGLNPFGFWITTSVLALIRFISVRDLKLRVFSRKILITVKMCAIFLPPWWGLLNERYLAAQMSATFLLFAFSRTIRKLRVDYIVQLAVLFSLLSYSASLLIPIIIWINLLFASRLDRDYFEIKNLRNVWIPILAYSLWIFVAPKFQKGIYESQTPTTFQIRNFIQILSTVIFRFPTILFLYLAICASIIFLFRLKDLRKNQKFLISFALISPILAASTYAEFSLHSNDPERVWFPISVVLVINLLVLNICIPDIYRHPNGKSFVLSISSFILIFSIALGNQIHVWHQRVNFQKTFLLDLTSKDKSQLLKGNVLIQDTTGKLGDIYTFYADSLLSALVFKNYNQLNSIQICTVSGVKQITPIADRFPLPRPNFCNSLHESDFSHILVFDSTGIHEKALACGEKIEGTYQYRLGGNGLATLSSGWSQPEEKGIWSDGKNAKLVFCNFIHAKLPAGLVVSAGAFLSKEHPILAVDAILNGISVDSRTFTMANMNTIWNISIPRQIAGQSQLVLEFAIHNPISPQKLNLSADARELGISLFSLSFKQNRMS